jgi:hypothetical protein
VEGSPAAGCRRDELAPVTVAARRRSDEQILEPAVLHSGPDAQAVAKLTYADRIAVAEREQELGVLVVEQLRRDGADHLRRRIGLSPPVAELGDQPRHGFKVVRLGAPHHNSDATLAGRQRA